jgi:hypothetical protein
MVLAFHQTSDADAVGQLILSVNGAHVGEEIRDHYRRNDPSVRNLFFQLLTHVLGHEHEAINPREDVCFEGAN